MLDVHQLTTRDVAGICDHTFLLRPECFRDQADPLAAYDAALDAFLDGTLALDPAPYALCVRAEQLARVRDRLAAAGRTELKLAAVVGFPLGDQYPPAAKVAETRWAIDAGADEIDTVLCWKALRAGRESAVAADVRAVVDAAPGAVVKVIFEICELTDQEIACACHICRETGARFVKTSTGFAKGGATAAALRIMRENFDGGIKLAGGVKAANLTELLVAALGPQVDALDPLRIRIGESSLLAATS